MRDPRSVVTREKDDLMPSDLPAETLKDLYLLFSDESVIDLGRVLHAEAHPLKRTW